MSIGMKIAGVVSLLATQIGLAQVVPPPPPAPEPTPEYVPPPPPPQRPRPEIGVNPAERPARTARPARDPVPDVQYESLVVVDEAGRITPVVGSIDLLAMQRNPLITEQDWAELEPKIREWQIGVERFAVDNIDLLKQIDGGLIDGIDINDHDSLGYVTQVMRPFQEQDGLITYLARTGGLDVAQASVAQKIAGEYREAVTQAAGRDETGAEGDDQESVTLAFARIVKVIYEDSVRECRMALDRLLADAPNHSMQIMDRGVLDAAGNTALRDATSIKDDQSRIAAVRTILQSLDIDKQREFLGAVLMERAKQ